MYAQMYLYVHIPVLSQTSREGRSSYSTRACPVDRALPAAGDVVVRQIRELQILLPLLMSQERPESDNETLHSGQSVCLSVCLSVRRLALVIRYWDMHHFICQFCHTDLYAEGAKILALAHTVTEICTTSFVNFVILICMLKVLKF